MFHLSDFAESTNRRIGRVPRRFLLSNKKIHSLSINEGIAAPGDILVGRIGRNLHEKVCIVEGGNCLISDCIFAVRVLPAYREKLLLYLTSNEG
ncbi:hypothetical protein, partial [Streptomyces cyaneofuscatus]|uniref:hypothetical protein n=1 Tax=Streptomyces cyaneofuscatus TaxID=66883 RepID=UPI002FF393C5